MYHSIGDGLIDPWGLKVSPENFAAHLEIIGRVGRARSVADIADACRDGRAERDAIAVTFDDGYADNLLAAAPLLQRRGVPGTVFVVSGHVGVARAYWWDELAQLLLQPGDLPEVLTVELGGETREWTVGGARHYRPADQRADAGQLAETAPAGSRLALYYEIWQALWTAGGQGREERLDSLWAQCGRPTALAGDHRVVTLAELRDLASRPGIEIGAHSVSHAALPQLDAEGQRHEVGSSRRDVEAMIGRPVRGFAYPFGAFSEPVVDAVRDSGFGFAVTTREAPADTASPLLQLPRFTVRNWSAADFEERLSGWIA